MERSRCTEEQIALALRQAEGGTPVADVCRQMGVSEASFYLWKKKYGRLGLAEIRELRRLRDENARLQRLVVLMLWCLFRPTCLNPARSIFLVSASPASA